MVILDNETTHHDDKVIEIIQSTGAIAIFTASYCPHLNPIDFFQHQQENAEVI